MKQLFKQNHYLKVNVIGLFFLLFILISIYEEVQLKKDKELLIKQKTSIQYLKGRVDELEDQNSDLEDKVNDLESRLDDLENN